MNKGVFAGLFLLAGCVSTDAQMLDDRTAMISGRGTGFDSSAGVTRKLLSEAATMAQARGYEYFQVVGMQDASTTGLYRTPTNTNAQGSLSCFGYTCSGSGTATTSGGSVVPIVRPGADVMVRFWRANEVTPDMQGVFKVSAVLAQGS